MTKSAPSAIGQEIFGPALDPPRHHEHALTAQEQELLAKYDKNGDGHLDDPELQAAHGAAQQQRSVRDAMARQMYDRLLEKFDAAKQGKLSADEQRQALDFLKTERPEVYARLIKQFGRNGDGELNAGEAAAVFQYLSNLPSGLGRLAPKEGSTPAVAGGDPMMMAGGAEGMNLAGGEMTGTSPGAVGQPQPAAANPNARNAQLGKMYARLLKGFDHENQGSLNPSEQTEALDYIQTNNPEGYERMVKRFDRNGDGKLDAAEAAQMFDLLAKVAVAQRATPNAASGAPDQSRSAASGESPK